MNNTKALTRQPAIRGVIPAILKAGLLAGSLDILVALIQYNMKTGKNVLIVLKFIASAVYGKDAMRAGNAMAAIGLGFHFIIAFGWTILFFLLYPIIPLMAKNKVITGVLYGVFIWLVMNLVVLPMTNVPKSPINIASAITGMVILVCAVGLPVSIIAKKYYSKQDKH
ncbi:MAG: hypothetical protein H7Z13_06345 [Ferruginibacter sp.]|nr:hypothetical protein [Ferruginibacter sp.]